MTKIGVGVGEDFPIEDRPGGSQSGAEGGGQSNPAGGAGPDEPGGPGEGQESSNPGPHEYDAARDRRYGGCGWGYGDWDREEWRRNRAEWRRHRHEWKARHREWRRRFRAEMRARGYRGFPFFFFPLIPMLIGLTVFAILVTGVVTIVAAAPVFILGLALLFVLYAAHRRRDRYYDCRYYEATPTDRPSNGTPPAEGH
jgi:hypothetical protein